MKTIVIVAAAIAAGSSAVYAQDPPQTPPLVQSTQAPAPAAPPAIARPAPPSEQRLREVRFMEEVLASAVKAGATDLANQIRQVDPNSLLAVSPPHARGLALDGYGVVFDVDVPLANVAIVTTLRQNVVNDLRDQIHDIDQYLARATNPDEQQRLTLQRRFMMSELQMLAPTPSPDHTVLDPRGANGLAAPIANPQPPGTVGAATTDAMAPVPRIEAKDTNKIYSDAVKNALIDAMLDHSAALRLADDEWLVVAARDNSAPPMDGALNPKSGIILRIKGGDLTAFQRNQLTRDEVLSKVEIREWR
jgi:hypothetical protein